MTGFTSDPSRDNAKPLADFDAYITNLAACLRWDGVQATAEHKKMHAAMGFGMQEMAVISFEAEAGGQLPQAQQRKEAQNFADYFNWLLSESDKEGKLYPLFNRVIASVTDEGQVAIDTGLLKAAFRDEGYSAKGLLVNTLKYAGKRQAQMTRGEDHTIAFAFQEQPSPAIFGFTATTVDEQPSVSPEDIFSRMKEGAANAQWNGVGVEVERKHIHAAMGFAISDTIIRMHFTGEGTRTWDEERHNEEALNVADYICQYINLHLPKDSPGAEEQGIITATQGGMVEIQLEKLRSLVKRHPEMLDGLQGVMQDYARREQQVLQEMGNARRELKWLDDFSQAPIADQLLWLQEMREVFASSTGVETLLGRGGKEEKAKFEQFCAGLDEYVRMKVEAPEKFAEMQQKYPVYARTVEAYEKYVARSQSRESEHPRQTGLTARVEPRGKFYAEQRNEEKRRPDGSFELGG